MSPFLLCSGVEVAFRVLSSVAVAFRLRYASVTLRGGCVSLCFGPLRFVPGGLVPFRMIVLCRAGPLRTGSVLRRAQNRHFCVRMGDFSEIFGLFDTKMGFLCSGSITMAFLQITAHTNPCSMHLWGTLACAVASICAHRARPKKLIV